MSADKLCIRQEMELEEAAGSGSSSYSNNDGGAGGRNPLMNPVILAELFEVCELSDVFNFRLVCKEWYSLSLTRFRNDATLQIGRNLWTKNKKRVTNALQWDQLEDELDHGGKPFRSIHLIGFEFMSSPYPSTPPESSHFVGVSADHWRHWSSTGDTENERNYALMYQNMEQFWGKYGSQIRKLKLSKAAIYSVDAFKKVIFEDLPNLEEINIDSMVTKTGGGQLTSEVDEEVANVQLNLKSITGADLLPITWRSIFLHFPNIQKIQLNRFSPRFVDDLEKLGRNNRMTIKELKLLKLDSWSSEDQNEIQRLLLLPCLKLETCWLDATYCENVNSIFKTVLQRHGNTLKKLCMLTGYGEDSFSPEWIVNPVEPCGNLPFRTEPFLSLEEVRLGGHTCPNLHFLEQLPNLKILQLENCYPKLIQETDFERMVKVTLPQLHKFENQFYLDKGAVEMLVKVMPNLEILKTGLLTHALRVVCQKWRNLKELQVASFMGQGDSPKDVIGDEGITGIVAESDERLANITDLKDLQKLSIFSQGKIGDSSVWNGFIKLPKLRSLTIALAKETSQEAYNALVARHPESSGSIIIRKG